MIGTWIGFSFSLTGIEQVNDNFFIFKCSYIPRLWHSSLFLQKRNKRANIRIILFPVVLCLLLAIVQKLANTTLDKMQNDCGSGPPTLEQMGRCPTPIPVEWPAPIQVPAPEYRAVRTDSIQSTGLPKPSCRRAGTCPVTILFTGNNHSLGHRKCLIFVISWWFWLLHFLVMMKLWISICFYT